MKSKFMVAKKMLIKKYLKNLKTYINNRNHDCLRAVAYSHKYENIKV